MAIWKLRIWNYFIFKWKFLKNHEMEKKKKKGKTDVEAETPILWPSDVKTWFIWKDPVARKDWRQEEKGMTGWDGWMASSTQWRWVWVNSRSWWWTGRPGMLWSIGLQRVEHDWLTELNWTDEMMRCKMASICSLSESMNLHKLKTKIKQNFK